MTTIKSSSAHKFALTLAAMPLLALALAGTARADDHDHGRDHQRWEHREHYDHGRPGYYYAPPPPPVYYAPPTPPPGINLVFPLNIR